MGNQVTPQDIARDLLALDENTSTKQYGYTLDDDGALIVEVWNDDFHGTKAEYSVSIRLVERWRA